MARQAQSKIKKFDGLADSPAIQGIEKIYEANKEAHQKRAAEVTEKQQGNPAVTESEPMPQVEAPVEQPAVAPAPPVASPAPVAHTAPVTPPMPPKPGKKTQNGITIYVPMDYYMQILRLKMETGTPIKDIALQAVIEYLDRHKGE